MTGLSAAVEEEVGWVQVGAVNVAKGQTEDSVCDRAAPRGPRRTRSSISVSMSVSMAINTAIEAVERRRRGRYRQGPKKTFPGVCMRFGVCCAVYLTTLCFHPCSVG